MTQDFLRAKEEWKAKMKWGDMAEAARIAGVTRATFQEWLLADVVKGTETEKRNLIALKKAVTQNMEKRERDLAEAVAA